MRKNEQTSRQLKREIKKLLLQEDFERGLADVAAIPARKAVNPLFSFLCSLDEMLKWRSVTAMGKVVAWLAETDTESARVIMRRLMWHLNDESGGIGWGCPEAMGEVMARSEKLAEEFWCILISYAQPEGNFLEHQTLQRGLLWGIGRLAHARPQLLKDTLECLHPFLKDPDPYLRGLAAWAAGAFKNNHTQKLLGNLQADTAELRIYLDQKLVSCTVAQLAKTALQKIHSP
ncbi:MAG: HEAT repeat domain-containing protein [Desulfobacterales bacterium]